MFQSHDEVVSHLRPHRKPKQMASRGGFIYKGRKDRSTKIQGQWVDPWMSSMSHDDHDVSICLNNYGRSPTQSLLFTSKLLGSMDVCPSFLDMFNGMKVCLALGLNYVELFAGSLQCFWEVA